MQTRGWAYFCMIVDVDVVQSAVGDHCFGPLPVPCLASTIVWGCFSTVHSHFLFVHLVLLGGGEKICVRGKGGSRLSPLSWGKGLP